MSSDRSAYRVASLAAIPAIPFADVQWLPVRSTLGLGAFGVNAYRADAAGQRLIEDHTEASNGHEELYVVVTGRARFTIDGQTVEAPAGTCIAITDTAARRTAVGLEDETTVLAIGAPRGEAYSPTRWERSALAIQAIRAGRGDEGLETLEAIVAETPDDPWRAYDYACGLALTGHAERAVEELRAVMARQPEARAAALADPDFETLHERPDWESLLGVDR